MTQPTELTFLNLDVKSRILFNLGLVAEPEILQSILIDLGKEIKIQKRTVVSLVSTFGEIGGLRDVLATITAFLIGGFQSKFMLLDGIIHSSRVDSKDG